MERISIITLFNFLIITFFSFNFIKTEKIILPFKTKPIENPEDEFESILYNELYTPIEIGSPSQTVELFLTMRTSYFVIKVPDLYKNSFNYNKSQTYQKVFESTPYLNDVLKKGIPSKEKFNINKDFNINDKKSLSNIQFVYGTKVKKDKERHMGIIGLQFFDSVYNKDINIFNTLKQNDYISSYIWFLNFTSSNEGNLS